MNESSGTAPGTFSPAQERRVRRAHVFAEKDFHRLDIHLSHPRELPRAQRMADYFYTANIRFLELDTGVPLRARAAQFPGMTFVHAVVPPFTLLWDRDEGSIDRAALLLVSRGHLAVDGAARTTAGPAGARLLLPGTEPIVMRSSSTPTEVVYLSVPARMCEGIAPSGRPDETPGLPGAFLPAYAFAAGVCRLDPADLADSQPIRTAAEEVARTAIQLLASREPRQRLTLFGAAMEIVMDEYPNKSIDTASVAGRLGVSRRSLQEAFRTEGTSFAATLRTVRAAAAGRLMTERPELTRAAVAEAVGFGSVDSLLRAL
ncbi:helix-turn-helix domain-containing protein [Microbacterium sp. TNHR37B]|uniref:helix-turn-helix domain-containing protein n=1 Tax=Microbacterium sp. TNHR37B TaxID=1775956 RepID=UPI0007B1DF26|nr:helix-turn-helix domain-containing protein [Microbacterium sp. TNHR37B]KZE90003.1 hypothetical protein AVP41_02805 [Microbacterium sp. TNHR37B]